MSLPINIPKSAEWYREHYFISTAKSLIQPAAVNAAFATDALYWVRPLEESLLRNALDNSLCFGVYELPNASLDIAGKIRVFV
jgi:hypothetical protein